MIPEHLQETAIRLALSVLIGGLVGLNRDFRGKPAGVRTHALVSLGTALMVIVIAPPGSDEALRVDALSRVIQGVLTGIGFLGAGVILRDPGTRHVSGLTTAATIWLTALFGVACGAGFYAAVLVSVCLGAVAVLLGGRIERGFRGLAPAARDRAPASDSDSDAD